MSYTAGSELAVAESGISRDISPACRETPVRDVLNQNTAPATLSARRSGPEVQRISGPESVRDLIDPPQTLHSGGYFSPLIPWAVVGEGAWPMTTHLTLPVPARTFARARLALTDGDAARVAVAIDAELAESTRTSYASAWRQWETWCRGRGLVALPAAPEALAAYLAERAESGLCFGTLDGACSAIAHRPTQEGLPAPPAAAPCRPSPRE